MPHPKNRIKQTGDTHMPDVGEDLGGDDIAAELDATGTQSEVAAFSPAASGMAADGGHDRGLMPAYRSYMAEAGEQVRAQPLAALGGAFLLGFVLARLRG